MKKVMAIFCLIFSLILTGCGDPEGVVVTLDAPISVANGDEFIITATLKNTASKEQKLASLDIGDKYLEGIAITKTVPDHSESSHVGLVNLVTYTFDVPIKAGEELEVYLYAKAIKNGDFNADIDFCINNDYSYITKSIRTVVK